MEKNHFEILLEHIESNTQLLAEGLVGVNERLDKVDGRLEKVDGRLDKADGRLDRLEAGQEIIKTDVRDIKRNMGLINSIANDHETRLQGVENKRKAP